MDRYPKKKKDCLFCGESFLPINGRSQYCSLRCKFSYYLKTIRKPPNGCWNWDRRLTGGYGEFKYNGVWQKAHRVSYEVSRGCFDKNLGVLHKCDNSKCVNPKHLFLGTQLDNMRDCKLKGRNIKGEKLSLSRRNKGIKLTVREVFHLRRLAIMRFSHKKLANVFGITPTYVSAVHRRVDRGHI